MKALVTGGAGFIGSHLCEELSKKGYEVIALDNLSVGSDNLPYLKRAGVKFIKADIRNLVEILPHFKGVDYVFHLAAMNRAGLSIEAPLEANENNVTGTLNVLEASRLNKVKRVIFSSSSSVYGLRDKLHKESDAVDPQHPYAIGKVAGEMYCRAYYHLFGLETTILRYCSVYGERQRGDIPYSAVIPKFIKLMKEGKPLTIYGDGNQTRQFSYVKDVVKATILAVGEGLAGRTINVASDEETSVLNIANVLGDLLQKKPEIDFLPPIPSEPKRNRIETFKAQLLLGFKPKYTFRKGVGRMVGG